jgi:hypothetical protein
MKKIKGIMLMMALTAIFTGQLMAQAATGDEQTAKQSTTQTVTAGKFVDNNNNGVCDNHETMKGKAGKGSNFTDANGDGVCDRQADANCGKGKQCCGKGQGQGNGCVKGSGQQQRNGCDGPCHGQKNPGKK